MEMDLGSAWFDKLTMSRLGTLTLVTCTQLYTLFSSGGDRRFDADVSVFYGDTLYQQSKQVLALLESHGLQALRDLKAEPLQVLQGGTAV